MNALARVLALALTSAVAVAQAQPSFHPDAAPVKTAATPKSPYYIDPAALNLTAIMADPAPQGSPQQQAELTELHRIEQSRTAEQTAQAKADEDEEDIFVYRTVLGPGFTPENLPLTAELGDHVKNEQSVAGGILKAYFERPRPYQVDRTLHPVCALTEVHNSYPSGHSLTGYLEALTLAELLPADRSAILARADEYAHNRLVCGVHYPTDTEASRRVAYVVFGYMLGMPKFQKDLATVRAELTAKLNPTR